MKKFYSGVINYLFNYLFQDIRAHVGTLDTLLEYYLGWDASQFIGPRHTYTLTLSSNFSNFTITILAEARIIVVKRGNRVGSSWFHCCLTAPES